MAEDTVFANRGGGHETWLIVSHFWVSVGGGGGMEEDGNGRGVSFSMEEDLDWIFDEITEYERPNFSLFEVCPFALYGRDVTKIEKKKKSWRLRPLSSWCRLFRGQPLAKSISKGCR